MDSKQNSSSPIGVGVIGANATASWAKDAHIPALKILTDDFALRAVSTTNMKTAKEAGEAFGADKVFDNAKDLSAAEGVDLVTVSVKVPQHFELASAAIEAGKNVFVEWPLGNGLKEAEELTRLAKEKGVKAFVGLQARSNPVIQYVKHLVSSGYVGEVLSASLVGSGMAWGDLAFQPYLQECKNGATMLSIPMGHTLDAVCYVLGEFAHVNGTWAVRRTQVPDLQGQTVHATSPDNVSVSGQLQSGALLSMHYRGGLNSGTNFLWEINGTEGDLRVTADGGHTQLLPLTLYGAKSGKPMEPLTVPDEFFGSLGKIEEGKHSNVAREYQKIAKVIRGEREASDFEDLSTFEKAVLRHKMVEAIAKACETGQRQTYL